MQKVKECNYLLTYRIKEDRAVTAPAGQAETSTAPQKADTVNPGKKDAIANHFLLQWLIFFLIFSS